LLLWCTAAKWALISISASRCHLSAICIQVALLPRSREDLAVRLHSAAWFRNISLGWCIAVASGQVVANYNPPCLSEVS
jgi:hypothetical protein